MLTWLRFNAVGVAGAVVQLVVLAVATRLGLPAELRASLDGAQQS